MKKFFENNVLKSWKTTMTGLVMGLLTFMYHIGSISEHDVVLIASLLTTFGFIASKDGNVSNTTPPADGRPPKK